MKILYFGTVCNLENYNNLLEDCSNKPSVAPIVLETALLDGFKKNNIDVEIYSYPMIPTFPKSKLIHFGNIKEKLACGYECTWLNTVNLPFLKQITRRLHAKKEIKCWLKKYKDEGIIFTYSIPPFLVKDVIKYGKKYSVKKIAIIPDLLKHMYINENQKSIITKLKMKYIKPALKLQSEYDGYIYLTEAMRDIVAPNKPYIVMEGIANDLQMINSSDEFKTDVRAIMYAGMLHEKYGILNLVDAFEKLNNPNLELWLFGDGTAAFEIKKRAHKNWKIRYFGIVNREKIIEYEKKATLLVNPRNPKEEFTSYSFPSKTIEYMLSGTPVLTTKLRGIPEEYFQYVFGADDNSSESLKKEIEKILLYSDEELREVGLKAKNYIVREKNSCKQVSKIVEFIKGVNNVSKNEN